MTDLGFRTPEELQAALGERIRKLRLPRNMAQLTTADKAGISEKALRNLEAGRGSNVEEMLAPDVTVNPLALLHSAKAPQRVRRSRTQRKSSQ